MGIIPSHQTIGVAAPILFGVLRFAQSLPAGGELPGAFCFLYESAHVSRRRYLTSWAGVGGQIGVVISIIECFFLEYSLPPEDLLSWGWRLSFMGGGIIGLLGLVLRYRLHETPIFKEIQSRQELTKQPLFQVINHYKRNIFMGVLFGLLNSVGYYMISIISPIYVSSLFGINYNRSLLSSIVLMLLLTVPMPFMGYLGDRWSNKKMLLFSAITCMVLLYPIYASINHQYLMISCVLGVVFVLVFSILAALIPYRFAVLFPAPVRVTCVGLSFNIVDGVVGGFSPAIALYFVHNLNSQAPCYWIILICALISSVAFLTIREKDEPNPDRQKIS